MAENFSDAKKELLQKWLSGQMQDTSSTIPKRSTGSPLKISFSQQWQLFIEMLQPGTAVNNLSVLLDISGKLDFTALEKSVNDIISRHEVLRTYFLLTDGFPRAMIKDEIKIVIPFVDVRNSKEINLDLKAKQQAEKEVLNAFDLTQAPLLRLKLYKLAEDHNLLLVIIHHSIADGWSMGVFLNELILLYQNASNGNKTSLPELSIQYSDFASWQTDESKLHSMEPSRDYWKKQLGGDLSILELPTDHFRSTRQSFSGGTYRFKISKSLTHSLEKFCQEEDVSMFMTLSAAFNVLLHRYSGQEDLFLGIPVANRNLPEIENLIGAFINTIVLRTRITDDPPFRELVQQVRNNSLDAYTHQDFPFERLVEELKPKRDLSRSPIFQVVFNLQNSPLPSLETGQLKITPIEIDRGVSQFDLTLMMTPSQGGYRCTVEYNSGLFLPDTISRIFDSFQLILDNLIINPSSPVSQLKLVDENYFHHIVHQLNQTEMDFPREKRYNQLFEEQVQKTPHSIAVVYMDSRLTYLELNHRTNKLARYLQSLGAKPGTRIGVLMEKTLETTEALLAIMVTGGIYVPISTSFPDERIKFILEDASIEIVITNVDIESSLYPRIKILDLRENNYLTLSDSSNIQVDISSDHLAYIIYTSGSTGLPKGVMVQHSSLMNFIYSMQIQPGINSDEVLLSVTSISFDIAALELFLPLSVGATVIIAGKEIVSNPVSIAKAIEKYNINIMQATPAVWQLLIDSGWSGKHDLKALCGGDSLTKKLGDQILERVDSLWNMYGPTETTIWSAVNEVTKNSSSITIGCPIGNTQLYILDKYLQPAPVGVAGELYIGGDGLAVGYLNKPELTENKFITVSFYPDRFRRLYKTGDRARYLPDYSIEVIGRTDYQVKINGHRIELGEISSVLTQHPLVRDAVTVVKAENSSEKKILAYYVSKDNRPIGLNDFQEFARKKLPAYMVPVDFIQLNEMPLNTSGKIDRNALPLPEMSSQVFYVAPRNEVEQLLIDIWQSVLQIDRIGVNDNFFDLGGASIQSLQVVASASLAGLQLNPEMIFEYQTIAELSDYLARGKKT